MKAKHYPRDDSKGSECAGHQLWQIISGNILDYLASAFCDGAIWENHGDSYDEVANATVAYPQ
jgi:hypothetical protein